MPTTLLIILLSIVFSAFFSGMEIAYIASNRLRIELDKKQGGVTSRLIGIFTSNPGQYITTMLVGNNIALVIYGTFMAELLEPYLQIYFSSSLSILLIQTIISTFVILITAEFLPKVVFRNNSNFAINVFALPVSLFYILLYPIAWFSNLLSKLLIKTTVKENLPPSDSAKSFSKLDLDNLIEESKDAIEETEEVHPNVQIFQNALEFGNIKIRECIVPRNEIVAVEAKQTITELRKLFVDTGYSRILVYENSIDNIVGYFHSSELFKKPTTIKSKIKKIPIIPETMQANKLLNLLIKQRKSIALVVDEYGGTAGMVAMEDIVEEIFGEIEDEHDSSEFIEKKISDNEYDFSARLEIDYINEKFRLNLPESDDYETLAGLIFSSHENLPQVGKIIDIGGFRIEIKEVSQARIETVKLFIVEEKD